MTEILLGDERVTVLPNVCPHASLVLAPSPLSALPPGKTLRAHTHSFPYLDFLTSPGINSRLHPAWLLPVNTTPRDPVCPTPPHCQAGRAQWGQDAGEEEVTGQDPESLTDQEIAHALL